MNRHYVALAGVLLCATPACADQFVTPLGGPSSGVVVERRVGTSGSVNVPVDESNPLPVTVTGATQGSTTAGQSGNLVQGAVTTAAPTYTTGQTSPLSLTVGGALRANIASIGGVPCTNSLASAVNNCLVQIGGEYLAAPSAMSNTGTNVLMLTSVGTLRTSAGGHASSLNITAAANVKTGVGRVYRVILNTAGSTATSIIDSAGTTATAANTIMTIPSTAAAGTVFVLDWPCATGISVVPGTSAVLAVSYE